METFSKGNDMKDNTTKFKNCKTVFGPSFKLDRYDLFIFFALAWGFYPFGYDRQKSKTQIRKAAIEHARKFRKRVNRAGMTATFSLECMARLFLSHPGMFSKRFLDITFDNAKHPLPYLGYRERVIREYVLDYAKKKNWVHKTAVTK
jgi:hypothetical protein